MKTLTAFALLVAFPFASARAQPASDWQDGVFIGPATDLFADASPQVMSFVKAHDDLAAQARIYIQPCAGDDTDGLCHLDQERFVLDYVAAFYGDRDSKTNIAYFLSGDGLPPRVTDGQQPGVATDLVWGCAWRVAILTSGAPDVDITDLWSYKTDCETLPPDKQGEAEGIAQQVLIPKMRKLSDHPTFPFALVDAFPGSP
jgi:hypothetical protein